MHITKTFWNGHDAVVIHSIVTAQYVMMHQYKSCEKDFSVPYTVVFENGDLSDRIFFYFICVCMLLVCNTWNQNKLHVTAIKISTSAKISSSQYDFFTDYSGSLIAWCIKIIWWLRALKFKRVLRPQIQLLRQFYHKIKSDESFTIVMTLSQRRSKNSYSIRA